MNDFDDIYPYSAENPKNNNRLTISAIYLKKDYGNYFKDDHPDYKLSVRPDADAYQYIVTGIKKEFYSPEETMLYLYANLEPGFSIELDMNDREANKFIKIWQNLNFNISK